MMILVVVMMITKDELWGESACPGNDDVDDDPDGGDGDDDGDKG